jgi:hypothetical protein
VDFSAFQLATFGTAAGSLASSTLGLTDVIGDPSHSIVARSTADAGARLPVRVGACLQWHGYSPTQPLYVVQTGGAPVTSLTLSGVKD